VTNSQRPVPRPLRMVERWRSPRGIWAVWAMAVVAVLLAGGGILAYLSGGTASPIVHVMYVPILLAAIFFRTPGGLASAIAAGLILGPWMPLDADVGTAQEPTNWVLRLAIFSMVGGLFGLLEHVLHRRLQDVEHLVDKLQTVHARTLSTFAVTVELRDKPTHGHCNRVGHNARATGQSLGLDDGEVRALYWAGLLHDLGKIAVPERILLKPASLTEQEFTIVKRHSAVGAELLEAVSPDFRPIAAGVRAHHERWDGGGYPQRLARKDIPLLGRILAVVDVFEALTCPRPYRRPIPGPEAIAYLRDQAGSQFDPAIVPVFEDLFRNGDIYTAGDPRSGPPIEEPVVVVETNDGNGGGGGPVPEGLLPDPRVAAYHLGSSGRP
jgi:HD domain